MVVECAAEDFVGVPLQDLEAVSGVDVPDAGGLVARGGEDAGAWGVEGDLGDLALVAD